MNVVSIRFYPIIKNIITAVGADYKIKIRFFHNERFVTTAFFTRNIYNFNIPHAVFFLNIYSPFGSWLYFVAMRAYREVWFDYRIAFYAFIFSHINILQNFYVYIITHRLLIVKWFFIFIYHYPVFIAIKTSGITGFNQL